MKDLYVELGELTQSLSFHQRKIYHQELERSVKIAESEGRSEKGMSVEAMIGLAKRVAKEVPLQPTPIRRHNGRVQESEFSEVSLTQQKQINAWMAMGHTLLEAEVMAGVHDSRLKMAAVQGRTAGQVINELKEAHGEGTTANQDDLQKKQQEAYRKMGLSMPELLTEGRR